MSSSTKEYYENQLKKVSEVNPEYPRTFQIVDNNVKTNWLSLNDESATELVKYLKKHYNVVEETVSNQ